MLSLLCAAAAGCPFSKTWSTATPPLIWGTVTVGCSRMNMQCACLAAAAAAAAAQREKTHKPSPPSGHMVHYNALVPPTEHCVLIKRERFKLAVAMACVYCDGISYSFIIIRCEMGFPSLS